MKKLRPRPVFILCVLCCARLERYEVPYTLGANLQGELFHFVLFWKPLEANPTFHTRSWIPWIQKSGCFSSTCAEFCGGKKANGWTADQLKWCSHINDVASELFVSIFSLQIVLSLANVEPVDGAVWQTVRQTFKLIHLLSPEQYWVNPKTSILFLLNLN